MEDNELDKKFQAHSVIVDLHTLHKESASLIIAAIGFSALLMICWFATLYTLPMSENTALTGPEGAIFMLSFVSMGGVGITLFIISVNLGTKFLRKRTEIKRNFLEVQADFIRRTYLMNFELVNSEGSSQKDKIFNHLCLVFPQVNEIKKKRTKQKLTSFDQPPKSIKEKFERKIRKKTFFLRDYDLVLGTSTGYFVIRIINDKTITFEDVKSQVEGLQKKWFNKDILARFIILGKSFDKSFEEPELINQMKTLKKKFYVDLIVEDDFGYSTIWIDKELD